MQIEETVMKQIDRISEENAVPKQKLVSAILKAAVENPNFILKIEDIE